MLQSLGMLNVFTLNLKQVYKKKKKKKKNGVKMECGSTNLMGSTKWAYHKEWTFAIDFVFLKSYFEYKNLLKIVDLL